MNEFERLQAAVQGQYIPTGSPIHRLDARARLVSILVLVGVLTFAPRLTGLLIGLALVLVLLVVARIPFKYALRSLIVPLPFLALLAAIQILFSQVDQLPLWAWGPLRVTSAGILSAVLLLVRFAALILLISLAAACISTGELIRALESLLNPLQHIGIQAADGVLALQVALHFLPYLGMVAARIAKAQAARGAEWGTGRGGPLSRARSAIPLIVPIFLTSLRKAEVLAAAMSSRAYGSTPRRTSAVEMHFGWTDALAILLAAAAAAAIFWV